ncbi:hypothetical protein [Caballeronia sp. LZ035]|uniref:hypothetical protein n=1 Tax=Caballeronia sp. LZ035 TaxID=3038568 RepID=UPI002856A9AD|nr:hypothetical protein [Caballeronia sp. LZ035]MDR5757658.1 hypothetical protein [Caballeronia sp. LZ035]
MFKKHIATIAILLSTVAAHAQTPHQDALRRNIQQAQDALHPCPGITENECLQRGLAAAREVEAEEAARARARIARARQQPPARYIDHYEPQPKCQPSQVMTQRDAWRQWAGISSGPQGWDCEVVMVPVYR